VQAGQRRARRHALLEARQLIAEERLDGALVEDRAVGALAQRDAVLVAAPAGPLEVVQQDGLGRVALGLEAFDLAVGVLPLVGGLGDGELVLAGGGAAAAGRSSAALRRACAGGDGAWPAACRWSSSSGVVVALTLAAEDAAQDGAGLGRADRLAADEPLEAAQLDGFVGRRAKVGFADLAGDLP
jgi:hypothetical protein